MVNKVIGGHFCSLPNPPVRPGYSIDIFALYRGRTFTWNASIGNGSLRFLEKKS